LGGRKIVVKLTERGPATVKFCEIDQREGITVSG
jgi:hypothetical protein